MAPRPPRSIKEGHKREINWGESIKALKYLPRFFGNVKNAGPKEFFINLFIRLVSALLPVAMLWVGKLIIDEIIALSTSEAGSQKLLFTYVTIEIVLVVLSDVFSRINTLTSSLLGDLYSIKSSVMLIQKTSEVEIEHLEDPEFYDKLERARRQTTGRVSLLSDIMSQIQDIITVATLITALIVFEPWLIVLLVLAIIPSFLNEVKFSNAVYSLTRSWTAERRELDYLRYIGANDEHAKEIKLFGLSNFIADRFKLLSDQYYDQNKRLLVRKTWWGGFFNIIGIATYYGAYIFIIFRVIAGVLTVGEFTFLSGSFNRLQSQLQRIFFRFSKIANSALYLRDYFDFVDLKPNISMLENPRPIPEKIEIGFRFENVSFKYPGTDKWILKNITFDIRAGEKMAFVGENGAGKSTLIKLMLRFYELNGGTIYLDDIPITEFDKAAYQNFFGVIFQDFIKYDFSLKENIGVGYIDELDNQQRIETSAEQSLASEVAEILPKKYDQPLGKRFQNGTELSGGQWQKVALARAYMKDAEVIILDEPTSALDARAEKETFDRFIGLTENKTAVIISHRFSTVRMADRILVLKDGGIEELGTHEELLANEGLYAELFTLQAEGYQ
jgi:ATP-binding cassette subfamily B protein